MSRKPYQRRVYWNESTMSWWERFYLLEILRGLSITGGVFLRNMGRWITGRKGALTTYYPEQTRSDYATHNRGKHILTQRPDGRPQCIACNMCATVCASQAPVALRDRLLALRLLRILRRGLPGGRHSHGEGSSRPAERRPRRHVVQAR
jgi:ferredoxin